MSGQEQVVAPPAEPVGAPGPATGNRAEPHVNLLAALAATFLAAAIYAVGLSVPDRPAHGFAIVLFTITPTCAVAAAGLLVMRARSEQDEGLRWVAVGLCIASLAMLLHLISFSAVATGGGLFGTADQGRGCLFLAWHIAFPLGALAGCLGVPRRWRRMWLVAGSALVLLTAQPWAVPDRPVLVHADGTFTTTLRTAQLIVLLFTVAVCLVWVGRTGLRPTAARGWVTVALALSAYDLLLNELAGQRYTASWWSSVATRCTTYAVLLGGLMWATARQLSQLERYTTLELDRAEGEVASWTEVTERLLSTSRALAAVLTPEDVAQVLSRAAAGALGSSYAGVAAVDLDDPSVLRLLDGELTDQATMDALFRFDLHEALPSAEVVRSGSGVFLETPGAVRDRFPRLRELLPGTPAGAVAAVPLRAGSDVIGALVVRLNHPRTFSTLEREMLAALGRQGGYALQHALLFERSRSVASALQAALLPERLPHRSDLELVARYRPATTGVEVGGDWYDALALDHDRTLLVIGDVMGKGLRAATLMGQFRSAIRALAGVDAEPSRILDGLDRLAAGMETDDIVTLTLVVLDTALGTATIGNAGHLPPVVIGAGPQPVLQRSGPPIGVPGPPVRQQETLHLAPGSSLLLVTDGLVEDRRTGVAQGLDVLERTAADLLASTAPLDDVADTLMELGAGRADDVTLLLARLPAHVLRLRLPADTSRVSTVRHHIAEQLAVTGTAQRTDQDALLLAASELVTNAMRYGVGPVDVRLGLLTGRVRLSVRDLGAGLPHPHPPSDDALGGRGLLLVEAVSAAWGVTVEETGKTVWADFPLMRVVP